MLHIPYFISKFGPPKNYDAQLRENSHIEFAKHPGHHSHKNFSNQSFEKQVAKQCTDSIVINALHKQFFANECNNMQCSSNTKDAEKPSFEYTGSQWYIECNDVNIPCVIWKSKQNCASTCVHSQALVEYLCNNYDIDDLMLCTEVVVKGTKY